MINFSIIIKIVEIPNNNDEPKLGELAQNPERTSTVQHFFLVQRMIAA